MVVLGAGLVGIYAISGLLDYKVNISLVEMGDRILPLQLDEYGALKYQEEFNEDNYKKIIHKNGKIYGAIIQGDLSYAGILTQLIKEKIDISKVKKSLFDIDYSDFFNIKENLEYTYKCKKSILNIEWIFCIYDFKRRINGIYEIR